MYPEFAETFAGEIQHDLTYNLREGHGAEVRYSLDKQKQADMKPARKPEQAACCELLKGRVLQMLRRNGNDTISLIALCLLVTSH